MSIDLYALLDEIPEIKFNSGRKPKEIKNRYYDFFQRIDKKHIPSIIDDLIRGACTASYAGKEENNKANDVINSYILKECMFNLTSFSAAKVQNLKCCTELSYSYIMKIIIGLEGLMKRMDHHFDMIIDSIPEINVKWITLDDGFSAYVNLDTGEIGSRKPIYKDDEFTFDIESDAKDYEQDKLKDRSESPLDYLDRLIASGLNDDEIINHIEGRKNNTELWTKDSVFKHIPYEPVSFDEYKTIKQRHLKMWGTKPNAYGVTVNEVHKEKYKHGLEGKINIVYI